MNKKTLILVLFGAWLPVALCVAGGRVGGDAQIAYESVNAGGASYASAGNVKLGGTLGQSGFCNLTTDGSDTVETGFWKADSACEEYPTVITDIDLAAAEIGITFSVMLSNTYSVAYVTEADGGLPGGVHSITNPVGSPVVALTGLGSVTTVYHTVSASTNGPVYYLIRCE